MYYQTMTPNEVARVVGCTETTERERALLDALEDTQDELADWQSVAREHFGANDAVELGQSAEDAHHAEAFRQHVMDAAEKGTGATMDSEETIDWAKCMADLETACLDHGVDPYAPTPELERLAQLDSLLADADVRDVDGLRALLNL